MTQKTQDQKPRVLFLHGLEGSPQGQKAQHLLEHWGAYTPQMPSGQLIHLKSVWGAWVNVPSLMLSDAVNSLMEGVEMAIRDFQPDIVVGSSMGGALAFKAMLDGLWSGPTIFLNPAIFQLLRKDATRQLPGARTVWILGSEDVITPYPANLQACAACDGASMVIDDNHRLAKAVTHGYLDAAIKKLWKEELDG